MAPYNLRPHPNKIQSGNGIVKSTVPSKSQQPTRGIILEQGLLSLQRTTWRLESATRVNSSWSSLLNLPKELRTQIYEYLLVSDETIWIGVFEKSVGSTKTKYVTVDETYDENDPNTTYSPSRNLDFLRTCRLIYAEASAIYYTKNTFGLPLALVSHYGSNVDLFAATLREGQRDAIRYIELGGHNLLNRMFERDIEEYRKDTESADSWDDLGKSIFATESLTTMFPNLKAVKINGDWDFNSEEDWKRKYGPDWNQGTVSLVRQMLLAGQEDVKLVFLEKVEPYLIDDRGI